MLKRYLSTLKVPRLHLLPIQVSHASYSLTLVIHRRTLAVILKDLSKPISLTFSLIVRCNKYKLCRYKYFVSCSTALHCSHSTSGSQQRDLAKGEQSSPMPSIISKRKMKRLHIHIMDESRGLLRGHQNISYSI